MLVEYMHEGKIEMFYGRLININSNISPRFNERERFGLILDLRKELISDWLNWFSQSIVMLLKISKILENQRPNFLKN